MQESGEYLSKRPASAMDFQLIGPNPIRVPLNTVPYNLSQMYIYSNPQFASNFNTQAMRQWQMLRAAGMGQQWPMTHPYGQLIQQPSPLSPAMFMPGAQSYAQPVAEGPFRMAEAFQAPPQPETQKTELMHEQGQGRPIQKQEPQLLPRAEEFQRSPNPIASTSEKPADSQKESKEGSQNESFIDSCKDLLVILSKGKTGPNVTGRPHKSHKDIILKRSPPFFVREIEHGAQLLINEFTRENIKQLRSFIKASSYTLKTLQGNPSVGYYHSKCPEPNCPASFTLKKFQLVSSPFIVHNH